MTPIANIRAAWVHLGLVGQEIEQGIVHDAERLAGDVRDFLHLGRSEVNSRRCSAEDAAQAHAVYTEQFKHFTALADAAIAAAADAGAAAATAKAEQEAAEAAAAKAKEEQAAAEAAVQTSGQDKAANDAPAAGDSALPPAAPAAADSAAPAVG
ncbi:MAG TPA: hypothetical protein VN667_15445 [Burkholderiales bacterium]|nr:hypothetical protein [Burkholderiales bacterium]